LRHVEVKDAAMRPRLSRQFVRVTPRTVRLMSMRQPDAQHARHAMPRRRTPIHGAASTANAMRAAAVDAFTYIRHPWCHAP